MRPRMGYLGASPKASWFAAQKASAVWEQTHQCTTFLVREELVVWLLGAGRCQSPLLATVASTKGLSFSGRGTRSLRCVHLGRRLES